ncbi:MAG: hypothetical protein U0805_14465 [Pirellulales bacterium]
MGLFWDLYQQSQISNTQARSSALEERVELLQNELHKTQTILHEVIRRLEQYIGKDLDDDGRIG